MGMITNLLGGGSGKDAGKAAERASQTQAQYQQQALDYLKQTEAIPQQFREEALKNLAGAYGLPGGASASEFMQRAQESPIYQSIMGNLPQMEEAVLRNQNATGALRTGATDLALANNQRLLQGQALGGVLQGIQGLAQLPSLAPTIANVTSGIGQTLAQGQVARAQAEQSGQQNGFGNMLGLGQLGLNAYQAFCDPRLKKNARKIGEIGGVQIYEWEWNKRAEEIGLVGTSCGPMADEIMRIWPDRIQYRLGYMYINPIAEAA